MQRLRKAIRVAHGAARDKLHHREAGKMTRYALPLALLLGACAQVQTATDKAGRDAAKTIMPEALAVYFPQVPKELFAPFTNCVVDNASAAEVQALAGDAITGVDQSTADVIRGVIARQETQNCLRQAAPAAALAL